MRYIALSFDDSRADTYEIAKPIMEKYGLIGTVNVISDFVLHPDHCSLISSPRVMIPEQLHKWQRWGGEIACHGSTHNNTPEDVIKNIEELRAIGFASPSSWLTHKNMEDSGIYELKKNGTLSYLRSGIQIRREGIVYTILSVLEQYTHSKYLYYYLNKRNIIKRNQKYAIYRSAAIKDFTTVKQIQYIVEKMNEDDGLIIMLHGVLDKGDQFYGKDHYYWDSDKFDNLCRWLKDKKDIEVVTTIALHKIISSAVT